MRRIDWTGQDLFENAREWALSDVYEMHHRPPRDDIDWAFIGEVEGRSELPLQKRGEVEHRKDYQRFLHWYREVERDLHMLIQHCENVTRSHDMETLGIVVEKGKRLCNIYRTMLEQGRIQWLPKTYSATRYPEPREPMHVVDRAEREFDWFGRKAFAS